MRGKIICKGSAGSDEAFVRRFADLIVSTDHSDPVVRQSKKVLFVSAGWRTSEYDESHLKALLNQMGIRSVYNSDGFDENIQNLSLYHLFKDFQKESPAVYRLYHEKQNVIKKIKQFYRHKNAGLVETFWDQFRLLKSYFPDLALHDVLNFGLDDSGEQYSQMTPAEAEKLFFCQQVQNTLQNIILYDQNMIRVVSEIDEHFVKHSGIRKNKAYQNLQRILFQRILSANSIFVFGGDIAILINRIRFFDLRDVLIEALNRGTNFFTVGAGSKIFCDKIFLFGESVHPGEKKERLEFFDNGLEIIKNIQILPQPVSQVDFEDRDTLSYIAHRFNSHTCVTLDQESYLYIDNEIHVREQSSPKKEKYVASQEQRYIAVGETDYLYVFTKEGLIQKKRSGEEIFPSLENRTFSDLIEQNASPELVELLERIHHLEKIKSHEEISRIVRHFLTDHQIPLVNGQVVTFVYFDPSRSIRSVQLSSAFGHDRDEQVFFQYKNTGIFYFPLELQPRSRLEYRLVVERSSRKLNEILDPNNKALSHSPFGPKSVITTSDYIPSVFTDVTDDAPGGSLSEIVFRSRILGSGRRFKLYLPFETEKEPLPVAVFHDGYDYLKYSALKQILDRLIGQGLIAPMAGVFSRPQDRFSEYGINDKYADFVADELLQEARKHIPNPAPGPSTSIGASLGGLVSLFLSVRRPDAVRNVILQSGSYFMSMRGFKYVEQRFPHIYRFVDEFLESDKRSESKMILSCGRFEGLIYLNRIMVEHLHTRGYDYKYFEYNDGHNWVAWSDIMPTLLTELFGSGLNTTQPGLLSNSRLIAFQTGG